GVMTGLEQIAEAQELDTAEFCARLDALVHGTTTADNTMIETDGAPTGLLVTEGHRDEIELRRVHKEEIWDPSYPAPPPIARRRGTLLGSGPTGGGMGASLAAQRSGISDFVAVDMGGTSYDVCLVRGGQPEIKTDWNWRYRYYIGLPMVDVQSVGAGGGSIA